MKIISTLILLLSIFKSYSQQEYTGEAPNTISLSLVLPDNSEMLSQTDIRKLESKIQHLVNNYGVSGEGYTNNFVIYPTYEIYEHSEVEGMKDIHVIEAEFNLFVKEINSGKIFGSYNESIKGDGYSKAKAITKSISKISTGNREINAFMDEVKNNIIKFYTLNCPRILDDADTAIKMQQYQKAIGLLYSIPKEVSGCYKNIQEKQIRAYNGYINNECTSNITQVKASLAKKDYNTALSILSNINPQSNCYNEAVTLISSVENKIDAAEKERLKEAKERRQENQNMERDRLKTLADIAKAYYNSKPQTVIYKSLF
ncbi:MAG: hypothetical protein CML16_18195 [Pusillimonas sp.]|nr:hypothetical protein [Pusillimonas sp.]|tara:strand:+ start:28221 stop:29165 length:945 start_codon:yes stop_codon:yes gene_type:complete